MRELGRKSAIVQSARQSNAPSKNPAILQSRFEDELYGQGVVTGGGGVSSDSASGGMYS